jgi:hypothetical protein
MTDQRPVTTTDAGIAAPSDEFSQTPGPDGPLLLQDHYILQKMAQFDSERVPERVVHAKGGGAYGSFEATEDVSQYTKASLFTKGKTTRLLTSRRTRRDLTQTGFLLERLCTYPELPVQRSVTWPTGRRVLATANRSE